MLSSRLVIGSGRSTGDHVTRDFPDTSCHRQEIPASQSSRSYNRPLLSTPLISVSAECQRGVVQIAQ